MPEATCDIGLIGLAVMGQNLVLNMNDHGFKVAVFNRTVSKVDDFLANEAKGTQVVGAHSIEEFAGLLKSPRRVMMMVKAGDAVDQMIEQVLPHLEKGDIIIDGGNSLFTDSNRRTKDLADKGHSVYRHRRFRRRRRRAVRPVDHAGRQPGGVAACEGDLPGDCGQGGETATAVLRLGGRRRRRPLREDGAQRHRVWRYAADLRGVPAAEARAGPDAGRVARGVHGVEQGRAGQLPDRDFTARSLPRRTRTARRWWTRFWTRPGRRARASGRRSARSIWACR